MNQKKKAFILHGYPCCGKGTNAKRYLAEAFNHPLHYIGTGDMFRELLVTDPIFAAEWGPVIEAGGYVSDEVTKIHVYRKLDKLSLDRDIMFDGLPRTLGQGQQIVPLLQEVLGYEVITLHFELTDAEKVILTRLDNRRRAEMEIGDPRAIRKDADAIIQRIKRCKDTLPALDGYLRKYTIYTVIKADQHKDVVFSHFSQQVSAFATA